MHILPYDVAQSVDVSHTFGQFAERQQQVSSWIVEASTFAGNAEGLARATAFKDIDVAKIAEIFVGNLCDVAEVDDAGVGKFRDISYVNFTLLAFFPCDALFKRVRHIFGSAGPAPVVQYMARKRLDFGIGPELKQGDFLFADRHGLVRAP